MRREFFQGGNNDNQLKVNLDCLDKMREQASKPSTNKRLLNTTTRGKAQKTQHRRSRSMQNHTSNKGLSTREARTNMERALQGHPLLKTRELPPRIDGREKTAMSMEHQAFEEVSSLKTNNCCNHECNLFQ